MTSSSSLEMELSKILSQLDLRDENSRLLAVNRDCFQRLYSTDGHRPDGRRLLGRSAIQSPRRTPVAAFFSDGVDDTPGEMSEVFRSHRSLDRSVSEPHPNIHSPRSGSQNAQCSSSSTSSSSSSRYKTELCRPFEENGSCKYGEKCQFAHGRQELRTVARHPKYKTDLCKTYHTTGLCPYGPRCHFIHNDDERYLNLVNRCLLQQQMKDSLIEKSQLEKQRQVIAAALAAQKTLAQQQQQQQSRGGSRSLGCSINHISSDVMSPVGYQMQLPFVQPDQVSCSLSDSSSSQTDSPTPSPTSSMSSDDPTAAAAAAAAAAAVLGAVFQEAPNTQTVHGMNVSNAKFHQTKEQHMTTDATEYTAYTNPLMLLMTKLHQQTEDERQQKIDALIINYLVQKNSSDQQVSSTDAVESVSSPLNASLSFPFSPPPPPPPPPTLYFGRDYSSTSRDTRCFSFEYADA